MGHGLRDVTGMYFAFCIYRASASLLSSARHTKTTRPVEDRNYSHRKLTFSRFFFFMVRALVGQGLLVVNISRSQSARHTTVGRTPLEEWSARRRDLNLVTHTTVTQQKAIHSMGFEPAIPASQRPQTHALDRTATGTGRFPDKEDNSVSGNNCCLFSELY